MTDNMKIARSAGVLYLIIIAAGIFAEFFVRQSLIVPGDAGVTAANIAAGESLFRLGIAGDLLMVICDIALAVAFFLLLRPVSTGLALLAASFRLVQAAILGINLLNLFVALQLLNAEYLTVFRADQLQAQALLYLDAQGTGYTIALVFFGVQCLVLGYLVFKSGYFPKLLGVLLVVAGIGYLTDCFANFLLVDYAAYESIFAVVVFAPAIIGELALALWLLMKGVNIRPQAHTVALPATPAKGTAG